jgi:hypothetical protein
MSSRIDYHDDTRSLCAVSQWRESDRPEVTEAWYPIMKCRRADWEHVIGLSATPSRDGTYAATLPGTWRPIVFILEHGGATKPVDFRRLPISAPKVRKGIRLEYRDGAWRKLLKTGWALA